MFQSSIIRKFLVPIVGLIVGLQTCSAMAQATDKPAPAIIFDTDSRLDRHVTMDVTGIPLDQLFSKLSGADLELMADSRCATQRVQIVLKDRPLRTLMNSIANLMPGSWKAHANGHGYSFYMTPKALAQREEWWRLYRKQHDVALENQRRYILKKLEEKPPPPAEDTVEGQVAPQQFNQMQNVQRFYYKLPQDVKVALANQMVDTLMYNTSPMFVSDGSQEEGAIIVPLMTLPDDCVQAVRSDILGHFLTEHHIAEKEVKVRLANEGRRVTLSLIFPPGQEILSDMGFLVGQAPDAAPLGLRHELLVRRVKALGKQAPEDWKRLAAYQEQKVWPNDPPKDGLHFPPLSALGPPRMAECLNWLKERAQIEFVADYYDRDGSALSEEAKAKAPAEPLKLELDRLAVQNDISWKNVEGGIYLFRNNRWYRDDRLQVPLPLLRQFTKDLLAHPALNTHERTNRLSSPEDLKARMDLEARVVTELSPFQILSGLEWAAIETHPKTGPPKTVFPFAGFAYRILHERYTALFYGSLSDAARRELIAGRLSWAELNAEQQRQAVFLLPTLASQPSDDPLYLQLSEVPKRAILLDIPGGNVGGIRLERALSTTH